MKKELIDIEEKCKVLFLGDSITDDGKFISFINTYISLYQPNSKIELINLGVSSENLTGLTEKTHPFPRPCLFSRLDKALEELQPDFVISMYGINDGIYLPFYEKRFEMFKQGYVNFANEVKKIGAKHIILTPTPFEKENMNPNDDIFKEYNGVMTVYSNWIVDYMPNLVYGVIDLFKEVKEFPLNLMFKTADGIHPDLEGHLAMASAVLSGIFNIYSDGFIEKMRDDKFKLFKRIYNHDRIIHSYYKEKIGHENIYKDKILTQSKLISVTEKKKRRIHRYIKKHKKLCLKNH